MGITGSVTYTYGADGSRVKTVSTIGSGKTTLYPDAGTEIKAVNGTVTRYPYMDVRIVIRRRTLTPIGVEK